MNFLVVVWSSWETAVYRDCDWGWLVEVGNVGGRDWAGCMFGLN